MKKSLLRPTVLLGFILGGSACLFNQAAAQSPINGLSRCLVYTFTETETSTGRQFNNSTKKVQYSTTTLPTIGLLIVGPRKNETAAFFNHSGGGVTNVSLKVADTIEYRLFPSDRFALHSPATYTISVLNLGRMAAPSEALLALDWHNKDNIFRSNFLNTDNPKGKAVWARPYPGLTPIWHAPQIVKSSDMTRSARTSQPMGFLRSATDDSKNLIDAYRSQTKATYKFDQALSERVKNATTLERAKTIIENYLRSSAGGSFDVN